MPCHPQTMQNSHGDPLPLGALPQRPLARWVKSKNPASKAVRREAEEDWVKRSPLPLNSNKSGDRPGAQRDDARGDSDRRCTGDSTPLGSRQRGDNRDDRPADRSLALADMSRRWPHPDRQRSNTGSSPDDGPTRGDSGSSDSKPMMRTEITKLRIVVTPSVKGTPPRRRGPGLHSQMTLGNYRVWVEFWCRLSFYDCVDGLDR
jgi:hypothetical protein